MKKMDKILMGLSFILASSSTWAGQEGHGGDAYKIGQIYYSLDLVEAGIDSKPYFDFTHIDVQARDAFNKKLLDIRDLQVPDSGGRTQGVSTYSMGDYFGAKMSEIKNASPLYYRIVMGVLDHYQWVPTAAELEDIHDVTSNVNLDSKNMAQAAVRYGQKIWLNTNILRAMNSANIIALIFHEINYAILNPRTRTFKVFFHNGTDAPCEQWKTYERGVNVLLNSDFTREFTAGLFSVENQTQKLVDFLSIRNLYGRYAQFHFIASSGEEYPGPTPRDLSFILEKFPDLQSAKIKLVPTPLARIGKSKFYELHPEAIGCSFASLDIEQEFEVWGAYNLTIELRNE